MAQLDAYLSFNGNCREAMTFYKECLGGELNIMTVGDSPVADKIPDMAKDSVMHADLKNGRLNLLGSDMMGKNLEHGNAITLCLNCSSEDEIQNYFSKLSSGGKVTQPLRVEFWGGTFGTLTDRFGLNWMFNYDKNRP